MPLHPLNFPRLQRLTIRRRTEDDRGRFLHAVGTLNHPPIVTPISMCRRTIQRMETMTGLLRSPRRLTGVALTGAIVAIAAYLLMGPAFVAAENGSGALVFELVGFALFVAFAVGMVALVVGIVGILVWLLRK